MPKDSPALATLPNDATASLKRLGLRIRAHRMQLGWTVVEMSERLFCAPATYRAVEAGKAGTSIGMWVNAFWLLGQLDSLEAVAPFTPEMINAGASGRKRRVRRSPAAPPAGRIGEDERDF